MYAISYRDRTTNTVYARLNMGQLAGTMKRKRKDAILHHRKVCTILGLLANFASTRRLRSQQPS
jgi:hypothetical protein